MPTEQVRNTKHKITVNTVRYTADAINLEASTAGLHVSVTMNPERLTTEESIDMLREGKSCRRIELNSSGQCSTSYTSSDRSSLAMCFAGTACPERSRSVCTVFSTDSSIFRIQKIFLIPSWIKVCIYVRMVSKHRSTTRALDATTDEVSTESHNEAPTETRCTDSTHHTALQCLYHPDCRFT